MFSRNKKIDSVPEFRMSFNLGRRKYKYIYNFDHFCQLVGFNNKIGYTILMSERDLAALQARILETNMAVSYHQEFVGDTMEYTQTEKVPMPRNIIERVVSENLKLSNIKIDNSLCGEIWIINDNFDHFSLKNKKSI